MNSLHQIIAIARTEFRFGIRRGAPVIVPLLIGIIFGAGILLGPLMNLTNIRDGLNSVLSDPIKLQSWADHGITVSFFFREMAETLGRGAIISIPMAWPILLVATFLLLPAAAATSIPADRQFGSSELLRSLPVSGTTYLAGKVLGYLINVILIGVIPFFIFLIIMEVSSLVTFQNGLPFMFFWFFALISILAVLPVIVWAIVIGFLAGVPFRSRRAAIFPGLLAGILSLLLWHPLFGTGYKTWISSQVDAVPYFLLQNYHSPLTDKLALLAGTQPYPLLGWDAPVLGLGVILIKTVIFLFSVGLMLFLARLWLRLKENF